MKSREPAKACGIFMYENKQKGRVIYKNTCFILDTYAIIPTKLIFFLANAKSNFFLFQKIQAFPL